MSADLAEAENSIPQKIAESKPHERLSCRQAAIVVFGVISIFCSAGLEQISQPSQDYASYRTEMTTSEDSGPGQVEAATIVATASPMATFNPTPIRTAIISEDDTAINRRRNPASINTTIPEPSPTSAPPPIHQSTSIPIPAPTSTSSELTSPSVIQSFKDRAKSTRLKRAQLDKDFYHRVNPQLNDERFTMLLYGWGENFEPPNIKNKRGSISLITCKRVCNEITVTLDIEDPDTERLYLAKTGRSQIPMRIDQAFEIGGIEHLRTSLEKMTGLAIDQSVAFEDRLLVQLIKEVYGKIEINNPWPVWVNPIYFDGIKYPERFYKFGKNEVDEINLLQYIKGLQMPPYDSNKENAHRKSVGIRGIIDATTSFPPRDVLMGPKLILFITKAGQNPKDYGLTFDFNPTDMVIDSIKGLLQGQLRFPSIGENIYVVDIASVGKGKLGGGVTWYKAAAKNNQIISDRVSRGVYSDSFPVELPSSPNADPNATDVVTGYYPSVREVIFNSLRKIDLAGK